MRKVLALALSLSVVLSTQLLIWRQQGDVAVAQETIAGSVVDRYEPTGVAAGTVVVAHGFSANRITMRQWGYAMARQGFRTYVFDQPGHGESTLPLPAWHNLGPENPLGQNLTTLVDEMVKQGKAHPGRIAFVGHSMGATTVLTAAARDDRIAATVAISAAGAGELPPDRPKNLLNLVAERDPASVQRTVTAMARPVQTVPGKNHITVIYSGSVIHQTASWIHQGFGTQGPGTAVPAAPWWLIWVTLVAALGVVLSGASILAPAPTRAGGATYRAGPGMGLVILAVAALTAVLAGVYLRLPGIGVAVVDYVMPYFLVMAGVLLALRLLWPRDFAYPVTLGTDIWPQAILRGTGVFIGYAGAVGTIIHMNLSSYIPLGPRILPILLLALGLWPFFVQEEGLKRAVASGSSPWLAVAVGVGAKLIMLGTWLGSAALPNPPAFLVLVTPVALTLMLALELLGFMLRRWHYGPVAIATFSALVLGWSMAVTFPLV